VPLAIIGGFASPKTVLVIVQVPSLISICAISVIIVRPLVEISRELYAGMPRPAKMVIVQGE
jgi:hypothetical protein